MEFIPLYHKDKLLIINPEGDTAIITLWTPAGTVKTRLHGWVDISPKTSRIAVIGNLYGNGLPELLRNMLYNPQITNLVIFGSNLSGSAEDLMYFFKHGLEEGEFLGQPVKRIIKTGRVIDGSITPDMFPHVIDIRSYQSQYEDDYLAHLNNLPQRAYNISERVKIPMIEPVISRFPTDPRSHNINAISPVAAWKELLFQLLRFGTRKTLKKGDRIELQNVKITLEAPLTLPTKHEERYQRDFMDPHPPIDQPYTYGNRIRDYFGLDALDAAVENLLADKEHRGCYISLWDTKRDSVPGSHGHPCLVSLFFRVFDEKLTLTATFRTHNALDGWLMNTYGLAKVLEYVALNTGIPVGAITVFSHSITIDPSGGGIERAKTISKTRSVETFRQDPRGSFIVSVDRKTKNILVDHLFDGQRLKQYRGRTASIVERRLTKDCVTVDIGHAMYLGRQIRDAEIKLTKGEE